MHYYQKVLLIKIPVRVLFIHLSPIPPGMGKSDFERKKMIFCILKLICGSHVLRRGCVKDNFVLHPSEFWQKSKAFSTSLSSCLNDFVYIHSENKLATKHMTNSFGDLIIVQWKIIFMFETDLLIYRSSWRIYII